LPGSINQKPGRNSFKARIVSFTGKEYTLKEICDALGVVPDEATTSKYRRCEEERHAIAE
jgi:rRNA maturation protein Nop10